MWEPYPGLGVTVNYEGRKPLKIWDSSRKVRKGIIVGSYEELDVRGREKMGIPPSEPVSFVLENDGTQVEDGEYFRSLPINTVLVVLRRGECWYPVKLDFFKTALTSVPNVVCDTIQSLNLEDEMPSWKIMDNKGKVTVVLYWEQTRVQPTRMHAHTHAHTHTHTHTPRPSPPRKHQQVYVPPSMERSGTIITPSGKKETLINDIYPPPPKYSNSPQITVINHDEVKRAAAAYQADLRRMPQSNSGLTSTIHIHTLECAANAHEPAARAASPENGIVECDFHCCSLHEEGRAIVVQKSVATSPIQDPRRRSPQQSALSDGKKSGVKQHVRFLDLEEGTTVRPGQSSCDSSESDTENTNDDDSVKTQKYLLLVDQPNRDRKDHLSIKDIGVILERLSSTILDVEKLNRDTESKGCYNWTMKATIRGLELNDLGLIYKGCYYVVSEHPDYKEDESGDERTFRRDSSEDDRL